MDINKFPLQRWNTNRHYTEHGQRIATAAMPDGSVLFVDIDRGIDGVIPPEANASGYMESTMYLYDRGHYRMAPYELAPLIRQLEQFAAGGLP